MLPPLFLVFFMFELIFVIIIAFVANTFSAYSGGGAGLLQFPALIFLGLPFAAALATHKIATVGLGIGAALRHSKNKNINFQISALMLGIGVPAVLLGAWLVLYIPETFAQILLGVLTVGLGVFSFCKPELGLENKFAGFNTKSAVVFGLGLFAIGFLNGSLSSGSGLFATMWLVGFLKLDYKLAVAHTMIWVGLCWNASGSLLLGVIGEVHWHWVAPLLIGAILGGFFGAHLSIKKDNKLIKRAFEIVTIAVGLGLLIKTI